jgi:hypothetical protein
MGRRLTLCKRRHADTFPLTGETGLAHFCHSVCGFLLFHLQSASSSALFPGKCLPEHSGTRGAEVTFRSASSSYRRRSAARLDGWSLQEFGGLLPIPKGTIQSSCFFCVWFLLQSKGRRAHSRGASGAVMRSVFCLGITTVARNEMARC